ncbi:MAG: N-acetylglutaminylglutamine amidotransferase [Acidiferrobacterales bacterium]
MCGICGEMRFDGAEPDLGAVVRMMGALKRRGPDHEGAHSDGPVAFGHRRLAIIDLSEGSDQPMVDSELKLCLVFNGTIYNYRELRSELVGLGYHFFSSGDTEVILKAYHAWGECCVERMNGMFAFVIWDSHKRELLLARDRLGIKPLYYSADSSRFRFASNTQALLAAGGIDTAVDPEALHFQLTLHGVVPAPRTILRGIRKLAPATTLRITPDGRQYERRYWELSAVRPSVEPSGAEWLTLTRAALTRAVDRQYGAADTPVGVLLSGGLDSSLLVGLLDAAGVKDIPTFSIGFEESGGERADEFEYSDVVASRFQTRHHRYHLTNDELLRALPDTIAAMAEPMVSQDVAAFYLLAERVARNVKVVLSGQGADEAFAGYYWYPRMQAESGSDLERFRAHYFDRSHADFGAVVAPVYLGADYSSEFIEARLAEPGAQDFLDRVLRLDVTTLLVDDPLKRVDNLTMAWGLEARVPLLDHDLVELAAQMPSEFKLREGGKFPLKAVARGLIPDAVIDRPKGYFPMPALTSLSGGFLAFMRDILDSAACRQRGLFDRAYVEGLFAAPDPKLTPIGGAPLRHLAFLELWLQMNVDRAVS